jgi:hypothetical protein
MRWEGQTDAWEMGSTHKTAVRKPEGKKHWLDLGVDGTIIEVDIKELGCDNVHRIQQSHGKA